MIKQLTEDEYKSTMTSKMIDVTETIKPSVDIWPYVLCLTNEKLVTDYVYNKQLVEIVYRNDKKTFDHVLLPTDKSNVFIVIIVDLEQLKIKGHFQLDLNEKYGIN